MKNRLLQSRMRMLDGVNRLIAHSNEMCESVNKKLSWNTLRWLNTHKKYELRVTLYHRPQTFKYYDLYITKHLANIIIQH